MASKTDSPIPRGATLGMAGKAAIDRLAVAWGSSKAPMVLCALVVYLLGLIFTAPTRHGADRFYLLALNLLQYHSINIQRLVLAGNHYALVTVDLIRYKGGAYTNLNPGQALWGLPGLAVYRLVRQLNVFTSSLAAGQDQTDKLDFVFGSFAMNATSSAAITAITALFFMFLASRSLSMAPYKQLKIAAFTLLFYLATPLFYYSTHIVQNESETCLAFLALGTLCLAVTADGEKRIPYDLAAGLVVGLGILTNFSSFVLVPFAVVHIWLSGFGTLEFGTLGKLYATLRAEIRRNTRSKIRDLAWVAAGLALPIALLLAYQYKIFKTPFHSVTDYLFHLDKVLSPNAFDYAAAFVKTLVLNLFSPQVGLFTFSPLLLFPLVILAIRRGPTPIPADQDMSSAALRTILLRTMILIQPLFLLFYNLFQAKTMAEMGWSISLYNLYSARYFLPIVFPLGFLLLFSLTRLRDASPILRGVLWVMFFGLLAYSLALNVTATFMGDWIYSVSQVWQNLRAMLQPAAGSVWPGRQLVDW